MSRSVMLEKIRRAKDLRESTLLPEKIPEFPVYQDPLPVFAEKLGAADGVFLDGRGTDHLQAALTTVLQETGAREIYWEEEALFMRHAIPSRLRNPEAFRSGLLVYSIHFHQTMEFPPILNSKPYNRENLSHVPVSVSSAVAGIAETGTVIHQVVRGMGRMLSILAPAHVVLLSHENLLMNHAEFFQTLKPGVQGSLMTLMTGPSRTADIEKTLILGVHGPQKFFVILTS